MHHLGTVENSFGTVRNSFRTVRNNFGTVRNSYLAISIGTLDVNWALLPRRVSMQAELGISIYYIKTTCHVTYDIALVIYKSSKVQYGKLYVLYLYKALFHMTNKNIESLMNASSIAHRSVDNGVLTKKKIQNIKPKTNKHNSIQTMSHQ